MSERRRGLPYIYATWLAKALGGARCQWKFWFAAHFKYDKHEEMASDLVKWNREHNALMRARRRELEEDGWTCTVEDDNAFRLQGQTAVLAGKPDLVAVKGDRALVVDGKTGRERDSDVYQVLLYLFAIPHSRPDLPKMLEGEVFYKTGAAVTLSSAELAPHMDAIRSMIRVISSDTAPPKAPSREECRFCNVGPKDCPQRVSEAQATTEVSAF